MPRRRPDWEKVSVRLYRDDHLLLARVYRDEGGYNHHVREAVHRMCNRIRARLAEQGRLEAVLADIESERKEYDDADDGNGQADAA